MDDAVQIMLANVTMPDGTVVANIERVLIGGGTQNVTVDGVVEVRQHPSFNRFHVRLLSPDRMIADQLLEADTYDQAVEIGLAYAEKRAEHAATIESLTTSLRV